MSFDALQTGLGLLASAGHLALFLLVTFRAPAARMGRVLGLLALVGFVWNFADIAADQQRSPAWDALDHASATLGMPLLLHVVALFVGRSGPLRGLLAVSYAAFGSLAAVVLADAGGKSGLALSSEAWARLLLVGVFGELILALALAGRHLSVAASSEERARTRLLLAALGVGTLLGVTDLLRLVGIDVPRLTPLGSLVGTSMVAVAALRFRLLDSRLSRADALAAAVLGVSSTSVFFLIVRGAPAPSALLGFGLSVGVLGAFAALRPTWVSAEMRRARLDGFAALGRMSAQLAHDLRNPISAILASGQYLHREYELGRLTEEHAEYAALIVEQARRLEAVVSSYRAVTGVEAERTALDLNTLVREASGIVRAGSASPRVWVLELDPTVRDIEADGALVKAAIENLLRNAIEASSPGSRIRLATRPRPRFQPRQVEVEIEDQGCGMNPRVLQRASEGFFSTKPGGSGLGLSFAKRVAEAHGGELSVTSREGQGTTVRLRLRWSRDPGEARAVREEGADGSEIGAV